MNRHLALGFLFALLALAGAASAGAAGSSHFTDYAHATNSGVSGVTNGGDSELFLTAPESVNAVGDKFTLVATIVGPAPITGGAAALTLTINSGCTSATQTTGTTIIVGSIHKSQAWTITTTGGTCTGNVEGFISAGVASTTFTDLILPFNVLVGQTTTMTIGGELNAHLCGTTQGSCSQPRIFEFLCNSVTVSDTASCTTPSIRAYQCDFSGANGAATSSTACLAASGYQYLCAPDANAAAANCHIPVFDVLNYGCNEVTSLGDMPYNYVPGGAGFTNCADPVQKSIAYQCGSYDTNTCRVPFTTQLTYICAPVSTVESIPNTYRLITPPTTATNCATPTLSITSWPTLTANAGITGSLSLSGTMGTQHLVVDSWPNLTAAVTESGTLNIQNPTGQVFQVAAAVSGGLTVTDDANGWSINIASWPQLQAILSGQVNPCSSAALAADPHACDRGITNVNNTVGAVMVPDTFHVCGPELAPGDCSPVQSNGAMTVAGLFSDPFLHGLLWLIGLVFFLRLGKVLAAGASTMGFAASCTHAWNPMASDAGQLIAILVLGIALWLEAIAREKIYTRWFKPAESGAVKPQ
jgi:hypothetical protein